ncbi:hypothetical protein B0H63DRAFT_405325, partial [Podospora didyma]
VVLSKAHNAGLQTHNAADSKDVGNLYNTLPLCIGARAMSTESIWSAAELVNGAVGNVFDLARHGSVDGPREEAPFVMLVKMDKYEGLPCFPEDGSIRCSDFTIHSELSK